MTTSPSSDQPSATAIPFPRARPRWWPGFDSTVRSTALTARLGRALAIAISLSFLTGLLSYYQYVPWSWLPAPASPAWGYRLTQGVHVATGTATIPLVLIKLWSIYPNTFRWPPFRSVKRVVELLSLVILVGSMLLQLVTGFLRVLNWLPFPWDFVSVHYYLAYVVVGSVLLHIGVKLPDIRYGLQTKLAAGDVLTEIPWNENPDSHSNAGDLPAPVTPGISRRGVLTASAIGIAAVVVTSIGQALNPLERIGLLAPRQPSKGLQGVQRLPDRGDDESGDPDRGGHEDAAPGDAGRDRSRQITGVAVRCGVLVPRDLGEYVARGQLGLQPVPDVRKLHADVQRN